jgi:hypothetical protein
MDRARGLELHREAVVEGALSIGVGTYQNRDLVCETSRAGSFGLGGRDHALADLKGAHVCVE